MSIDTEPATSTWHRHRGLLFGACLIVGVVVGTYARVLGHGFVNWDDGPYIVHNPMVADPGSFSLVARLMTPELGYPLPMVVWIYGLLWSDPVRPVLYHGLSVAGHVVNALLLAWLVYRHTLVPRLALVAALVFALHPIVVEPVAWASGLKDVLMLTAVLLAMLWLPCRPAGALMAMVIALAAKPSAVLFGLALCGVAMARDEPRRSKIAAAIGTVLGMAWGGYVWSVESPDLRTSSLTRASWSMVLGALGLQLQHVVAPFELTPRYPLASVDGTAVAWGAVTVVVVGTVCVASLGKRSAAIWFLLPAVALYLPVSNIVPLERFTADTYAYAPWGCLVAAIAIARPDRWLMCHAPRVVPLARALLVVLLIGWAALSVRQAGTWQSTIDLWQRAAQTYPHDGESIYRYGDALGREGRREEELALYLQHLDALADSSRIPAALVRWFAYRNEPELARSWYQRAFGSPVRQDDAVYTSYLQFVASQPRRHLPELDAALRYALSRVDAGTLDVELDDAQLAVLRGLFDPIGARRNPAEALRSRSAGSGTLSSTSSPVSTDDPNPEPIDMTFPMPRNH